MSEIWIKLPNSSVKNINETNEDMKPILLTKINSAKDMDK